MKIKTIIIVLSIVVLTIISLYFFMISHTELPVNTDFKIYNLTSHNITNLGEFKIGENIVDRIYNVVVDSGSTYSNEPNFKRYNNGFVFWLGSWDYFKKDTVGFMLVFIDTDSIQLYHDKKIRDTNIIKRSILDTLIINDKFIRKTSFIGYFTKNGYTEKLKK